MKSRICLSASGASDVMVGFGKSYLYCVEAQSDLYSCFFETGFEKEAFGSVCVQIYFEYVDKVMCSGSRSVSLSKSMGLTTINSYFLRNLPQ